MKPPLLLLPLMTAVLLSGIYLLPQGGEMAHSAIEMKLPPQCAGWLFQAKAPTEDEIKLLAADTEFSKAVCFKPRPGEYDATSGGMVPDRIDLSIVLSGQDLNNSIHRPERCMPSQGHLIGNSSRMVLKLPNGQSLPVRRLLSVQSLPTDESRTHYVRYSCVTYYFFVGSKTLTEDHLARTLTDMKDRLVYGVDQRWAYVSVSMWYGKLPWLTTEIPLEEADQKLREFLIDFTLRQIDWNEVGK